MPNKIDKEINDLISVRKNPVLVFIPSGQIGYSDCLECLKQIHCKKFDTLDILIYSGGGDPHAAYKIIKHILKRTINKVNVIVPLFAKSAATLICLGADEIILGEMGELGPLDTQLPEAQEGDSTEHKSALNYSKALEQLQLYAIQTMDAATMLIIERSGLKIADSIDLAVKLTGEIVATLYSQVDPRRLGESARALDIANQYGRRILENKGFSVQDSRELLENLIKGYSSHGFVLDADELRMLGLNARNAEGEESVCIENICKKLLEVRGQIIKLYEVPEETPPQESTHSENNESGNE